MPIVTVRRISQVFFLILFFWLCLVASVGDRWWQLRGWPVNWLLDLDPLTALATMLSTGTLYAPLLWSLAALVLTAALGRFFCGFACPLGALNQFFGWLGQYSSKPLGRVRANRPRPARVIKYYLLLFLLACALTGTLATGLLDPLPLLHRSINLTLAPILDSGSLILSFKPRHYGSAWLIGAVLLAILGLNLVIPRFFCRFACPLGALFGLLSRFAPWRIGKAADHCGECTVCEAYCEGACSPSGTVVTGECLMCCNCLERCPHGRIRFDAKPSAGGEAPLPDLSRRGVVMGAAAGLFTGPALRLGGLTGPNNNPNLIRPPGALDEERFLARCIRCGQCMRACPSNIIQPALAEAGLEGLWTPAINYRLGDSGCQVNCIACGQVCPTAAIRPLTVDEKRGRADFAAAGPIRLGSALVDRSRCLPWVLDRPCIVCQELCPVSPKAIFTRTVFEAIRDGRAKIMTASQDSLEVAGLGPVNAPLAGGDYYLRRSGRQQEALRRISVFEGNRIGLVKAPGWSAPPEPGEAVDIVVRLQRPYVDASRCIGCGMCEHECPVAGLRAIRVNSENESRSRRGRLII
ncbi:MAG: 4Fe-4S binding protein [Desulfovibrionaceae bacterium]|nr:4Fe-4S binding protein [Desulfovibrionaceae bacterium]MBF0512558.1 4Fe-4S binding protein [Desulfovibrionaceae bacterium]